MPRGLPPKGFCYASGHGGAVPIATALCDKGPAKNATLHLCFSGDVNNADPPRWPSSRNAVLLLRCLL
jgi:hypothetical protein